MLRRRRRRLKVKLFYAKTHEFSDRVNYALLSFPQCDCVALHEKSTFILLVLHQMAICENYTSREHIYILLDKLHHNLCNV